MSRFIQLTSQTDPTQLDEALLRAVMVANARYACNAGAGRNQGDLVFEEVVERRQKWPGYSSCGDLVHWSLRRAGYRDERVLNREDDDGSIPWRIGVNVSRLVYTTGQAFEWWRKGEPLALRPGDMALIGENGKAHVFIAAEVSESSVTSYDYGQWVSGKHGGKRVTRHIHRAASGRIHIYGSTLPGRPFIGRLDPFELLEPAFLRGDLEPAEVPDDFALGAIGAQTSGTAPPEPAPVPVPVPAPVPTPPPAAQRALVTTREIQTALVDLGYEPGPIDGIYGKRTLAAVKAFQRANGLIADGIVGKKTRGRMREGL